MINILEILKKIPNLEDMVFYSPLYGDVKVGIIISDCLIHIIRGYSLPSICLDKYGRYCMEGECMLYPSRQNRDWSKFKVSRKDLPKESSIMYKDSITNRWSLDLYSNCINSEGIPIFKYIIPVDKFNFNNWSFKEEDNYGTTYKE